MGKSTRKKQEAAAEAEAKWTSVLTQRGHNSGKSQREVHGVRIATSRIHNNLGQAIRSIHQWKYTGKSRRTDRQQLELLRYLFGKYPVPHFLENVMLEERNEVATRSPFTRWYMCVALGRSLYKECTREYMSKKETHWFLQAPHNISTVKEAIWWAKAMAICNDTGLAYRMCRSAITHRGNYTDKFWVDVHRFFVNNPVSLKEMDELIDYICAARRENENWTINKRSLESIRRKSEEWHRAQIKMQTIGGGSWAGMGVSNWEFKTGKTHPDPQKNTERKWRVFEITTGNALAQEGQRMRHCVAGYKSQCMNNSCAIFTMRSSTMLKPDERHLTIEVDVHARRITQARGLANRLPRPQEREILNKWAFQNGLTMNLWY